jgi:hypothetical protein
MKQGDRRSVPVEPRKIEDRPRQTGDCGCGIEALPDLGRRLAEVVRVQIQPISDRFP